MIVTRPALRYHGGKWMLAPWIIEHFPPHRVYVEPFGGGASVLLRKARSYAEIYNDLDDEVVNVFRVLRDPETAVRLREAVALTPFSRTEFFGSYAPCEDPVEWARRTICRSLMGFGSDGTNSARPTGFRANSNRSGTTPARDWLNYPEAVPAYIERLRGVVIEKRDATDVITAHDSSTTLFYIDPPYVHGTRSSAKAYRHEMTDAAHEMLALTLRGVVGMVVLSGYPSGMYRRLYGDWLRLDRNSLADGARRRVECLWLSPSAASMLQKLVATA